MTISNKVKYVDYIDVEKIVKMIPHRYPMLLIDKVVDLMPLMKLLLLFIIIY